jgi:PAS domain S-box-containing protein
VAPALDKAAYDDLPDGLLIADSEGRVVLLNPAGARLLGRSADEAVGRDYTDVLPLTDPAGQDWWACTSPYLGLSTRSGQPERLLVLPDGHELLVTARFVRDRAGGPVSRLVISFRDAAARRRDERNRADLVSTVAHELRSPLTAVKGFTATLLAKWDRFNDEQKQVMLQTVNGDADRDTRLISELLDVSRIDAGRLQVRKQVVDVRAAVQRAVNGFVAAGQPPERFEVEIAEELPEMWLDPDKLDQVLGNLIENAIRHGSGTVTIAVQPWNDGVQLSIADQGEGLSAEAAARVFTKFWRGSGRSGTGLGLYIAKGLAEAHGGIIEADTAPGGGALFRVRLPSGAPPFVFPLV